MHATTSRRGFVAGAVAATAATAIAATAHLPYGTTAIADEAEPAWDMAADMVVVGGGTGMGGAVAAAACGMSVILLEARPTAGGAMALSGGVSWLPNTEFSQPNGDTYDLARTYLLHMQQECKNLEVMDAFLDNTQNVIDTLRAGGVELKPMAYGVEYHKDWEGACNAGGRSCMVEGPDGAFATSGGGSRLYRALYKSLEAQGVDIFYNTTGRQLVTRRASSDAVPEVLGVIAEQADGTVLRIKANRGVLLATGGFEWDEDLVANYVRVPIRYNVSYSTNDGATLRMCQAVGADLRLMNEFWGQAVYTKQGELAKPKGVPTSICCQTERAVPGSIMVDTNGRRFCNEASDYDSQGNAMGGYNNYLGNGWAADPCWLVYDNTCYETYNVVGAGQDQGIGAATVPEDEMVIVADSLEELAEKIGVPAEVLVQTVDDWNQFAAEGRDPVYHRHETVPLSRIQDTIATLETPPFRAISISNGSLGTIGGPRLNKNAQVVHVSGEPIKGLYAMGNCAGVGAPGPAYGGGGGTIGPAFTMGVIAAHHAAERDDVTDTDHYVAEKPAAYEPTAPNEFVGVGLGITSPITVSVTVEDGTITDCHVVSHCESEGIGTVAIDVLPGMVVEANGLEGVDVVAGCTCTSKGVLEAVGNALSQAGLA